MKILIDARLYGPENAGLGRYVTNLVTELASLDKTNEYVILLRKKYFDPLSFPENWKKVLADFRHYSFSEQFILPGIIKKVNPDITHFPHFNVPILYGGKYIVTIHDMLMHKSVGLSATTLPLPFYLIKRLGYRFVFDRAIKSSHKIIVPTEAVKSEILEQYRVSSDKICVTYEGVDKKIQTDKTPNIPRPYFVYTGNAYPHKNLIRLVEAIKILNTKSSQKVFLTIASARNIFTQRIENLVQKMSMKDCVKILGYVPDDELGGLFKNSVGFVFPSISEGFGLPGLEALSAGTLLLASNIKVFKEVYEDNALYFDELDPNSIAETMQMAMSISDNDRKNMIAKGVSFVNRYSWGKMAQSTLEIYEEGCNCLRQSQ